MPLTKYKTMIVLVGSLSAFALGLDFSADHGFAQPAVNEDKETLELGAQAPASKDADEPAEKQSKAHFCWLTFGPKGKVRALVCLDGEEVAVDRDGDGKFDSKGERFPSEKECKDIVIADPDGKTSYVITYVRALQLSPPETFLEIRVHIRGPCSYPQCCIVQMAENPNGAPQAPFHGRLTIAPETWSIENRASRHAKNKLVDVGSLLPNSLKTLAGKGLFMDSTLPRVLKRTGEPTRLFAGIRTVGENSLVAVCSPENTDAGRRTKAPFPRGAHPFVDVEFPAKKPGDPLLKRRYPLDQFCCDGLYHGSVRVPEDAGAGKARMTFSFDTWKEGKVAPTTVEIPIEDPPKEHKDQTR